MRTAKVRTFLVKMGEAKCPPAHCQGLSDQPFSGYINSPTSTAYPLLREAHISGISSSSDHLSGWQGSSKLCLDLQNPDPQKDVLYFVLGGRHAMLNRYAPDPAAIGVGFRVQLVRLSTSSLSGSAYLLSRGYLLSWNRQNKMAPLVQYPLTLATSMAVSHAGGC
jgi:hypothetical protein